MTVKVKVTRARVRVSMSVPTLLEMITDLKQRSHKKKAVLRTKNKEQHMWGSHGCVILLSIIIDTATNIHNRIDTDLT